MNKDVPMASSIVAMSGQQLVLKRSAIPSLVAGARVHCLLPTAVPPDDRPGRSHEFDSRALIEYAKLAFLALVDNSNGVIIASTGSNADFVLVL